MNPNENPKRNWTPVWPDRRTALLRLLLITSVVFPLSWAVNALLVGSWDLLFDRNAESVRHLIQWQIAWIATVAVVFLLTSLAPVSGWLARFNPRRWILGIVVIVTLVVLFYAEENWRGARAWNQYRQELEAKGAQLNLSTFIPKPVLDEQNFAAIPFVKSWFEFRGNTDKIWGDPYLAVSAKVRDSTTNKSVRQFMNLQAWEQAFAVARSGQTSDTGEVAPAAPDRASRAKAAPGVLVGLQPSQSHLTELRNASRRPYTRYPVVYDLENPWGILLPHLAVVKSVCERLQLKACSELAAGHSDRALEDVKLMLRMADSLKEESFLISYLVRIKCVQLAVQPVWEGLADRVWSDAQLREIQSRFQELDFVADMKLPLDSERAAGVLTADLVKKKGLGMLVELVGPGPLDSADRKFANWCGGFIPDGWYDLERATYCRLYEAQMEGTFDLGKNRIFPERIVANRKELERVIASGRLGKGVSGLIHHHILAALLLPALDRIPVKAATGNTVANQVVLACASERFRMANLSYPEGLEALSPRFVSQLPADVLTGQPYEYRRTDDGQFVIRSTGWSEEADEKSSSTLGEILKNLFREQESDWVWQYPEK